MAHIPVVIIGFAWGWLAKASLDRAVLMLATRVLRSAVGRKAILHAVARALAKEDGQ